MRAKNTYNRRDFLTLCGLTTGGLILGCRSNMALVDLDDFILEKMERSHIPGLAAAIIKQRQVVWSKGFGWANIDGKVEMTPDTLQNIGSISKTFVGTAVMQLREKGALQLEQQVDKYLDFSIQNPKYPDSPITFTHLMTHRSSIADGSAYSHGYGCGDSPVTLEDWIKGYFIPDGIYYNSEENFHPWAPGEKTEYNNVAFGLLAYLVEIISGISFGEYCRSQIFKPLGMDETSWYLADIDLTCHAIPYSYVSNGVVRGPSWGGSAQGVVGGSETIQVTDGYAANCFYNHPNFPDGFLRTSVQQLARYLTTYLNGGSRNGTRLLAEKSILEMLRPLNVIMRPNGIELGQGLVWRQLDGVWGHTGGDPGINTLLSFKPSSGDGVIVFTNTWGAELREVAQRFFEDIDSM